MIPATSRMLLEKLKLENKPYKLRIDKNIPKFTGTGGSAENIDDWLFMVEQFKKYNNVEDENLLSLIIPLLRGQTLQMLKKGMIKNQSYNWEDFKER